MGCFELWQAGDMTRQRRSLKYFIRRSRLLLSEVIDVSFPRVELSTDVWMVCFDLTRLPKYRAGTLASKQVAEQKAKSSYIRRIWACLNLSFPLVCRKVWKLLGANGLGIFMTIVGEHSNYSRKTQEWILLKEVLLYHLPSHHSRVPQSQSKPQLFRKLHVLSANFSV